MKLSEYATRHDIKYRAAWNRYKKGKIPGAKPDETGHIIVPDTLTPSASLRDAAIYARVSDPKRKDQLEAQASRAMNWAIMNGYHVTRIVKEVGSGVNDKRRGLTSLLKDDSWGTLIVEHKDRLTRFGFAWFQLFIGAQGRELVVMNEAADDRTDLINDFVSIIYSFSARLYGQRRNRKAKELEAIVTSKDEA